MGLLQLSGGIPNFSKFIISDWFRAPRSSIDLRVANAGATILPITIPLMTFGAVQNQHTFNDNSVDVGVRHGANADTYPPILGNPAYTVASTTPVDPSYIGLECYEGGIAYLTFNFQTAAAAAIANYQYNRTRVDVYNSFDGNVPGGANPGTPGSGWTVDGFNFLLNSIADFTNLQNVQPEYFQVRTSLSAVPPAITTDTWHHLLLSGDLSIGCETNGAASIPDTASGTTTNCRLWYAIDDVNYKGVNNLQPFGVDGSADDNAILTANAYLIANAITNLVFNCTTGNASYSLPGVSLPSAGAPFGIPAAATYVDSIYPVDMYRPQVWTGATLDTGVEANRRLFIGADRKPVARSVSEAALGPSLIVFKNTKDFRRGKNSGTAGNFTPSGTINPFTPDP